MFLLNANELWYINLFLLGTFGKNENGFASYRTLITQGILVIGDVIKVMWLAWETIFGKALHDVFVFVYKIACFGQVNNTIEYNSIDCNIN